MFSTELGTAQSFCQRHPDICAMLYREFVANDGGDGDGGGGGNDDTGIDNFDINPGGGGGGGGGGTKTGPPWFDGGHIDIDDGGGGGGGGGDTGTDVEVDWHGQLDRNGMGGGDSPASEYNSEQSEAVRRVMMQLSEEERAEIIRNFARGRAANRAGTSPSVAIAHGGVIATPR